MRAAFPDHIIGMSSSKWHRLCNILNQDHRWNELLYVLPPDYPGVLETVADIENSAYRDRGSKVLFFLATKLVSIDMLREWFLKMELHMAVTVLDEEEDNDSCSRSVPTFRPNVVLEMKKTPVATSQAVTVSQLNEFFESSEPQPTCTSSLPTPNSQIFDVRRLNPGDDLIILQHPISPGPIVAGSSTLLKCVGQSKSGRQVHYQWYCEGDIMPGETSKKLDLENLYLCVNRPGFYYHCAVYTDVGFLLSQSAQIEMKASDNSTPFYASDKVALVIANKTYENLAPLWSPLDDAATISHLLKTIGFKVMTFMNLALTEVQWAVHLFCKNLSKDSYGLIYYAGHGFEMCGRSYIVPVDAATSYTVEKCVCVQEIVGNMQKQKVALSVLLLDMCRRHPTDNQEEGLHGSVQDLPPPQNVIYGYATSVSYPAYENKKSLHGYYMKHLKKHITADLSITEVLQAAQRDFETETNEIVYNNQIPWARIEMGLGSFRKLTDTICNDTPRDTIFADGITWSQINDPPFSISMENPFLLKCRQHKEQFYNAADLSLFFNGENDERLIALQFTIDNNNDVHSIVKIQDPTENKCLCIIEIINLQRIVSDLTLTATLTIEFTWKGERKQIKEILYLHSPPVSKLGMGDLIIL